MSDMIRILLFEKFMRAKLSAVKIQSTKRYARDTTPTIFIDVTFF
jgi:hypothetical protein